MSKKKISILTWSVIILTIGIVPIGVINIEMIGIICVLAFLFGIVGIVATIKKRNKGEIAICIFCVLINILIISLHPAEGVAREPAKRISCASNLKQIYLSLQQYAMDYNGFYPPENGAAGLEYLRCNDYLTDYGIYLCPSTTTTKGKEKQPLTEDNVDYVYVGGLNEKSAPDTPILYDKLVNHQNFGNIGYVDGHIESITGKNWLEKIKK